MPTSIRRTTLHLVCLVSVLAACGEHRTGARDAGDEREAPGPQDTTAQPSAVAELERAAAGVMRFLAGDAGYEALNLADTVELLVVPEGGGARRRVPREALRDRGEWRVGEGPRALSFVPPERLTRTTLRAGRHMNCRAYPLASKLPELASRPHVGVRLDPSDGDSCLQTWNATLVFDTAGTGEPRLVAAVRDQWEW